MITSKQSIFVRETEIRPNKHVTIVMFVCIIVSSVCWILNELGIFQVGKVPMRIGSALSIIAVLVPLVLRFALKDAVKKPFLKFANLIGSCVFAVSVNILIGFHATLMLLFPIYIAMFYRSKKIGKIASAVTILSAIFCPIFGYMLGCWDVPFFTELIYIATNVRPDFVTTSGFLFNIKSIIEILLYISFPNALMAAAFTTIMFKVIELNVRNVVDQVALNEISNKDNLTGLYNQNYFNTLIAENAISGTIGIIYFDVNGLKAINDANGHELGDLLLKRSALSLLNVCDFETIHPFRLGGDEFIIVVENATPESVNDVLNKWNANLYSINMENERQKNGITCSLAVGYAIGDSKNIRDLVSQADALMYENKVAMKQRR